MKVELNACQGKTISLEPVMESEGPVQVAQPVLVLLLLLSMMTEPELAENSTTSMSIA